ncbi:MAG: hypothetical protein ACOX6W_02730 [Lentisphaeria bacterium]
MTIIAIAIISTAIAWPQQPPRERQFPLPPRREGLVENISRKRQRRKKK